jgi:predicted nucleic acid-binding protein
VTAPEFGLLDTSAVILLGRLDPSQLPSRPMITSITLAELSVGPLGTPDEAERAKRQAHLQQAEADFEALPFDAAAARAFGQVAASLRRSGRKPDARAYDAMIAAIAVAHDMPLYTCNPRDFAGIDELEVVTVVARDAPDATLSRAPSTARPAAPGRARGRRDGPGPPRPPS